MNPSRETHPATADFSRLLSRRAVVLSLLSLPAALTGCGGDGGGESPSPSPTRTLPQEYTLAYRVEPPVSDERRISTAVNLTRDGTLLLTQSIPNGDVSNAEPEKVLTSFTNFGRPQDSVSREVLRVRRIKYSEGVYYSSAGGLVVGATSASEIYVPGWSLSEPGDATAPTFHVLSTQGELRRSVVSNMPAIRVADGIVECRDGTFIGRGYTDERQLIVRMSAQGGYLNTVMESTIYAWQYPRNTDIYSDFRTPAVTPSGEVYVFCRHGNTGDAIPRQEGAVGPPPDIPMQGGFLVAQLDGSRRRFVPIQPVSESVGRIVKGDASHSEGVTFSDDEGNLYVQAQVAETYPNPYPRDGDNPSRSPSLRGAVLKFAPDGTELGFAMLPLGPYAIATNPFIDAAVDGNGNIYAITGGDSAIYVYQRSR